MGWGWWTPDKTTKLLKCAEFADDCGQPASDGCCAVIPCSYCLKWEVYGESTVYGIAEFTGLSWTGTIAGAAFVGYWERGYITDECEFVVTLDGVEIYRLDCYGGQSCRDSSDSATATIGYDSGTLTWTRIEPRPLEYVVDYETKCRTHFCGACECSCDCLCVTIAEAYGVIITGEICDTAYPCDGPVWAGTVGDYVLSIALGQDSYGECVITPTVNGVTLSAVSAGGCGAMSATFTLDDGTVIDVECKVCYCSVGNCGDGCCVPWHIEALYPNGVLDAIPFCLTSDCVALDGTCGQFTPHTPTSTPRGACGFCASYFGDWAGTVPGEFPSMLEDPSYPGQCLMSPCNVSICLVLECDQDENVIVGQNACCSKMRLWVGTTVPQAGDTGERPSNVMSGCTSWKKISPTMCECDAVGGIIATFPVSVSIVCDPVVGGFCNGIADCCQVVCSFDVVV